MSSEARVEKGGFVMLLLGGMVKTDKGRRVKAFQLKIVGGLDPPVLGVLFMILSYLVLG